MFDIHAERHSSAVHFGRIKWEKLVGSSSLSCRLSVMEKSEQTLDAVFGEKAKLNSSS